MNDNSNYQDVVNANIELHSILADSYNSNEPHFRDENIFKVRSKLLELLKDKNQSKVLDIGCGTGFIINIIKDIADQIDGIDVTKAMLEKVSMKGAAKINLYNEDVATFKGADSSYDLVTAYSFIHHLYDYLPAIHNCYRMLKPTGFIFIDLEPNYYFWEELRKLDPREEYSEVLKREFNHTVLKHEDIEQRFNVSAEIFNKAEYGKNIKGGINPDQLVAELQQVGFKNVKLKYNWFLGEGKLINDNKQEKVDRFLAAKTTHSVLEEALPLTRHLFKYFQVVAEK